ncbi:MAG: hypothetical protein AAFP77_19730 [Bacteroidota bacterium]
MPTNNQPTFLIRLTEEEHQLIQSFRSNKGENHQPTTIAAIWAEISAQGQAKMVLASYEQEVIHLFRKHCYYHLLLGQSQGSGQPIVVE